MKVSNHSKYKAPLLLVIFVALPLFGFAQGEEWTWENGSDVAADRFAIYGTKGTADINNMPGLRNKSISWVDGSGDLWLFGGLGYDGTGNSGYLNDLWKYDGTNWTWVSGSNIEGQPGTYGTQGIADANNIPGARYGSISWIDTSGDLWLFGGWGFDGAGTLEYLNDLWKYDGTNWTWVSGSNTINQTGTYGIKGVPDGNNIPGARSASISWIDASDDLWLFGGWGYDDFGSIEQLNDLWKYDGTNWTWVSGSNTVNQSGTYGTKGIANPANIPGARNDAISWMDTSGNLWLFGGNGYDGGGSKILLNDLWKYDGSNWTWVSGSNTGGQPGTYGTKGIADTNNVPGARYRTISWIDASNNLWLFGGYGADGTGGSYSYLNDLWKYDGTNWTWASGSNTADQKGTYGTQGVADANNIPGARDRVLSWIDGSGDLMLFGGYGYFSGDELSRLNDLWKYDGTNWIWVSGSNKAGQPGIYGTKGIADPSNVPGAKYRATSWMDASNNLWLFGGYGDDGTGNRGLLNDLWKYEGTNWTWVSGSKTINQSGIYGTQGIADANNVPGARNDVISWIDTSGNLWLFGGWGYDVTGNKEYLNDLWKYDGINWTWVSGSKTVNQSGNYGTLGTADANNVPGARERSIGWINSAGDLWLFGGWGYDGVGSEEQLNDLWKYDGTNWTWVSGSNTGDQPATYGTKGVANANNIPGARTRTISWIDTSDNLWLFGGLSYNDTDSEFLNDLWKYDGINWTWVSGSNTVNQPGIYGTKGTADANNVPGARDNMISWIDASGKFWLFGGWGYDAIGSKASLNDLWKYDGTNWTWVMGSHMAGEQGTYGTQGIADSGNVPGARTGAISWMNTSGNLWLFGGWGYDGTGINGFLNDLWEYQLSVETDILIFSLPEQTGSATIDAVNHTVEIDVATHTDVTTLVPTFTLSTGATAAINSVLQSSGTTSNDYTLSVTYTITAEDASTQDWTVTVSVDDGLVAYFPFNANSNDESGNGYDGVDKDLNFSDTTIPLTADRFDNINSAKLFEENGDFVLVNTNGDWYFPITVVAWIYPNNLPQELGLVTNSQNLDRFGISSDGSLVYHWSLSDTQHYTIQTEQSIVNLNRWQMIAYTLDASGNFELYHNSLQVAQESGLELNLNNNSYITIGSNDAAGLGRYFNGVIDDVRYYNRTLSSLEIADLYHEGGWDNTPPVIENFTFPTVYVSGTVNEVISATISDDLDLATVTFNYEHLNAPNFTTVVLSSATDEYSFALTKNIITDVGLQYFFFAEDATGNTASTDTAQIVIQYDGTNGPSIPDLGSGGRAQDWRMFSIPFEMDNKSVGTIFESPLGSYDPSNWRIFHYKNDADGFVEYKKGLSVVERGKGYWFNSVQSVNIPMSPSKSPSNNKKSLATLNLVAGWNQIGNPYTFDVAWSDVLSHNGITTEVADHLRVFSNGTSLTDAYILNAFSGAYLQVDQPIVLEVPLIANTGGRLQKQNKFDDGWLLDLNLDAGIFSNSVSGLGMHPEASISKDMFDGIRSPRFEKYIDASFSHPEYFMPDFSQDVVPEQDSYVWEFTVSSNVEISNRIINWNMPDIPEHNTLTLIDLENGNVIDMLGDSHYSYPTDNERKFKVVYGDINYLIEQLGEDNFHLGNNYPNPLTNATTIPFSVYGSDDEYNVSVKIYSINGQLIKNLMNATVSSGIYSLEWDGKDNAGNSQLGMFIYSLEVTTDEGVKSFRKKMIVQ